MMGRSINDEVPLPSAIADHLQNTLTTGHFQSICIYSHEGLPIASIGDADAQLENNLLEVALMALEIGKISSQISELGNLHEVVVEGVGKTRFVYRTIAFLDRSALLAVVVPARKAYRGAINRLQKAVARLNAE